MNEVFYYLISPIIILWVSYVTAKIIKIDKKVSIIDKLIYLIDFEKIPKTKNINELIKNLGG